MNFTSDSVNYLVNVTVSKIRKKYKNVYGIPKNGTIIASMIANKLGIPLIDREKLDFRNTLVVDDIVDSGSTIGRFSACDCLTLVSKKSRQKLPTHVKYVGKFVKGTTWVNWFWENPHHDKKDTISRMIQCVGEDCNREGLKDTPDRVVRSFDKLYGGYKLKPEDVLKTTFTSCYDEVILLRDIPLFSTCEHHLLPFSGKCHIAYIPGPCGKVIGISKLVRLMEVFARRMQIQEALTIQIGQSLVKFLKPKGVAVIIQASHMCMVARGVEKPGSSMVTSYTYGAFRKNPASRQELLNLIKL